MNALQTPWNQGPIAIVSRCDVRSNVPRCGIRVKPASSRWKTLEYFRNKRLLLDMQKMDPDSAMDRYVLPHRGVVGSRALLTASDCSIFQVQVGRRGLGKGDEPFAELQPPFTDCPVTRDRLDRIELYAKDSRLAILKDGTRLPVSRSGYARLRELL